MGENMKHEEEVQVANIEEVVRMEFSLTIVILDRKTQEAYVFVVYTYSTNHYLNSLKLYIKLEM